VVPVDPPVGSEFILSIFTRKHEQATERNNTSNEREARHIPTALFAQHFASILIVKTSISIQSPQNHLSSKKLPSNNRRRKKRTREGRQKGGMRKRRRTVLVRQAVCSLPDRLLPLQSRRVNHQSFLLFTRPPSVASNKVCAHHPRLLQRLYKYVHSKYIHRHNLQRGAVNQ
jgi:hypothetical protein